MHSYTRDEVQEALKPIASLISKSEKAQQKLKPGTWQHTMLSDNLRALRYALALMIRVSDDPDQLAQVDAADGLAQAEVSDESAQINAVDRLAQGNAVEQPTRDDVQQILSALAKMIGKAEKAEAKFPPGTAQHTLQRNRLKALRIAEALVEAMTNGQWGGYYAPNRS